MSNHLKYFAKFIVEAATPIAIGSGEKGLTVDRLIIKDANDLPFIPGTSLAGVIRHELKQSSSLDENTFNQLFGFQGIGAAKDTGQGSRISFSSAQLIGDDGKMVIEGIQDIDIDSGYYAYFQRLPERDHVRITHRGVADTKGHGKFDEELVHKGTRFAFELELSGTAADKDIWEEIIQTVHEPFFRIGAGTRKGFGQLKVEDCWYKTFDLSEKADLLAFLDKSSSLNYNCSNWSKFNPKTTSNSRWKHYKIELEPENFFIFGAGFGDEDVDMKPKTERFFDWSSGQPRLEESQEHILIPATSVKGAISHRVAYHYNDLMGSHLSEIAKKESTILPVLSLEEVVNTHNFGFDIATLDFDSKSDEWEKKKAAIENLSIEDFYEKSTKWKDYEYKCDAVNKEYSDVSLLIQENIAENNQAVKTLFGYAKSGDDGARGKVIFSDVYLNKNKSKEKIFSHVAIDRFTGGGIDGALYQEKVVQTDKFVLDIYVENDALKDDATKAAFNNTIDDLIKGRLQLGGNTTKGHGAFVGKDLNKKNDE
jgi:CRISPR/Cas system CSM-associated protein Csm3 (group 7 of RAMP superfamily)